ncbi:arsenate reductase (glutaredoxin) [Accumulibacter sp.]|uniref:arsenate reductase (glutaredoxin) n=1 Tax=Accumulibacter sp. TaxID=2053492 RepID=UPI00260F61D7|nr:arsenate reductase (glutaredoxin) [Accumulibacter sp.]
MNDAPIRIYHNNRCSKSRAACQLFAERGVDVELVEYLKTPPTLEELRQLLRKLGMPPAAIVRRGEAIFKERYAGRSLTDDEWLEALATHPILIERPIVVRGDRAVLGRPPERALDLL